ncbi:MAG: indolepyruvate oxidoreductase subunit beta [Candidatus Saccharicenans sp.]|uniref:indolepyruvate oxidoreductase subunit beta n=1 Tax=Candidatus Saccharicenans sp. TaxID=2819258 RepID=UPI00404983B7
MKYDIILAGVGGQGILSIAFVIDNAALEEGLFFKQAEVHGMSQRGGAVQSHLRLADSHIYSDLIPLGQADMILSVEPLETLRYFEYLKPDGAVVSSSTPYTNISDYPVLEEVFREIKKAPVHVLIDSDKLAREAGSVRAQNMVILGAASIFLPLKEEALKKYIQVLFEKRGPQIVQTNLKAFDLGRQAARAGGL